MSSPALDSLTRWLAAAAEWHADHGDLRVPYHYETASGLKLGQWIVRQRVLRRRGRLDPSVSSALDALNDSWHAPVSTRFAAEFAALARFRQDHGHAQVPARFVTAEGLRLGAWLARQRRLGRTEDLPAERAAAFAFLGVEFATRADQKSGAAAYVTECRRWFQAHSHLRIPTGFRSNGVPVGNWLARQRSADRRGTIAASVASALDAIETTWPDVADRKLRPALAGKAERQQALLEAAQDFHRVSGHLRTPYGHLHNGIHLGSFMQRCRRDAANGSLSPDVLGALNKIDPHWIDRSGVPHRYRQMLDAAGIFHAAHQHLRVPKSYVSPNGSGLGWWLSDRRNQQRAGTLLADLGAALDAIDPAWAELQDAARGRRSASDASGLAAAREVSSVQNGHLRIPVRYQTSGGFKLGAWLVRRRKDH